MKLFELLALLGIGYLGYSYIQKKKMMQPIVKAGKTIGKGNSVTTQM